MQCYVISYKIKINIELKNIEKNIFIYLENILAYFCSFSRKKEMNLNFFKFFLLLIVLLFEKVLTYPKIYSKWINFKDKHLIKFKNVSNEEKAYAYFQIKDRLIEAHNNQSNMSYKMSHNEFSHWV
jgi:hypothetical protein